MQISLDIFVQHWTQSGLKTDTSHAGLGYVFDHVFVTSAQRSSPFTKIQGKEVL